MRQWILSLFVIAASAAYVVADSSSSDAAFTLDQTGTNADASLSVSPANVQPTIAPQPLALPAPTPTATRIAAPAPALPVASAQSGGESEEGAEGGSFRIASATTTAQPAPGSQAAPAERPVITTASIASTGLQASEGSQGMVQLAQQQTAVPVPMPVPTQVQAPAQVPVPSPQPTQQVADIPIPMPRPKRTNQVFTTASLQAATAASTPSGQYRDGAYDGRVTNAYYGLVQVQAVVQGGRLVSVRVLRYPNDRRTSRYISGNALPILQREAIAAQSARVGIISGATLVSRAYRLSLDSALSKARA